MKTIKERAKEYAPGISNSDSLFSIRISTLAAVERIGYIAGATEQKAIDIDKACEWLERANSALPPCYKMFEVNIKNFRKAMEE